MEIKVPFILNLEDLATVMAALKSMRSATVDELEDAKKNGHHKRARFAEKWCDKVDNIMNNADVIRGYSSSSFEVDMEKEIRELSAMGKDVEEIEIEKNGSGTTNDVDDSNQSPQPDNVVSILRGLKKDG